MVSYEWLSNNVIVGSITLDEISNDIHSGARDITLRNKFVHEILKDHPGLFNTIFNSEHTVSRVPSFAMNEWNIKIVLHEGLFKIYREMYPELFL